MSAHPERRKSSLTGSSPLTPPQPALIESAPTRQATEPTQAQVAGNYPRLNYYVDSVEQAGRIRAAFLAGRETYGWRTFTQMQKEAIMSVVEQLERELNNGQPFAPAEAGAVPPGRTIQ